MARADIALVLSCEHGGNGVPARYRSLFKSAGRALESHLGWDIGSLELARTMRDVTRAPLVATTVSRLVVECNRSLGHPRLFSKWTRDLADDEKAFLIATYHQTHRAAVADRIRAALRSSRRVIHVGVHTFTPVFGGQRRSTDMGVLYDPRRTFEREVAREWLGDLRAALPQLRVHRNRPYRGWTDGLTTSLRAAFPESRYAGIELEVNQRLVGTSRWPAVQRAVARALRAR